MFPEDDLEYVIENEPAEENSNVFNGKAFLYDFNIGDFVYKNGSPVLLEGKEALKMWIEKCLRTVKFRAMVHRDLDYGPNIDDLVGSYLPTSFVQAEIEREVTEALIRNPYINEIDDFEFSVDGDELHVSLTVLSIYDNEPLEVAT